MKRRHTQRVAWLSAIPLLAFIASAVADVDPKQGTFTIDGPVVHYTGATGPNTVKRLIAESAGKGVRKLVIKSEGGDALSGMRLGQWARDNRIDVTAHEYCISACANYVFPAGNRKIIEDGALLLWHGGTNDQRARNLIDAYESALVRQAFNEPEADDNALLEGQSRVYQMFALQIKQEARHFARIGVDPYLANMGREPDNFDALWTVSLDTMRGFGITEIDGPARYGDRSYLERWRKRYNPAVAVMRLKMNKHGKVAIDW